MSCGPVSVPVHLRAVASPEPGRQPQLKLWWSQKRTGLVFFSFSLVSNATPSRGRSAAQDKPVIQDLSEGASCRLTLFSTGADRGHLTVRLDPTPSTHFCVSKARFFFQFISNYIFFSAYRLVRTCFVRRKKNKKSILQI